MREHFRRGSGVGRIAIDLAAADAIEEHGKGKFAVYINGNMHLIESDEKFEDLAPEDADDKPRKKTKTPKEKE